jgi:DNA-3-methyladenine glycosylase II
VTAPAADGFSWDGAVEHLRSVDGVLRGVIDRVGSFEPWHEPDLWRALVGSIISQQLSIKAAATIEARVAALADDGSFPEAERILAVPEEQLRACGLSGAKTRYIRDLAGRWRDGSLPHHRLATMTDPEVIELLTQVKGIGRWTAEMVLIFTLRRPDVLPVDDLGFRAAVQREYGLPDRPGAAQLRELGEAWRPYRSVATLYLWRSSRIAAG